MILTLHPPTWFRRLVAILRYAYRLWRNTAMSQPLTLEKLTPGQLTAITRQAEVDSLSLEDWCIRQLGRGVTEVVRAQIAPTAAPDTLRQLDAVDVAFMEEDGQDPTGTLREGKSMMFGILEPAVPAPAPVAAPVTEMHARVEGNGRGPGPLVTTEQSTHPCIHNAKRYIGTWNANDCQGTCTHRGRGGGQGGESVCQTPPSAASSCSYYRPKIHPQTPRQPEPRELR